MKSLFFLHMNWRYSSNTRVGLSSLFTSEKLRPGRQTHRITNPFGFYFSFFSFYFSKPGGAVSSAA
jgi:hypothetical protein